jgi:phage terminase large subunit
MTDKTIQISKKTLELLSGEARYRVAYGGRASGKSHEMHLMALLKAMEKPLTILCARETMTSIANSVHATLKSLVEKHSLEGFTIQEHKVIHKNGSKFIFAGLKTTGIDSIKSMQGVNLVIIEEASSISQESWDKLDPTIREEGSEIWLLFNPDKETDPVYQMFIANPLPDSKVTKSTYLDNPFCPEVSKRQAEQTKARDYEKYLHVWMGELNTKSEAQVFSGKFTTAIFDAPENVQYLYGLDFGYSADPSALTRSYITEEDGKKTLYIDAEAYKYHVEIDHLPAFLDTIPNIRKALIYADCSRPDTINHLCRQGFFVKGARKGTGSVEDGISYLKGFDKIIIHERCPNTIKEFKAYSWKVHRQTGDVLPELEDKNNHAIDSLRYSHEPLIKGKGGPRVRIVSW